MNSLEGRVAVVTGGAQGMGRKIAELFSANKANVVVSDINGEKIKAAAKDINGLGVKADVTNESDVKSLMELAVNSYGTIDFMINNAGILRPTRINDISKEEWDMVIDVNLNGTFLCTKYAIPIMKQNQFGRIVNISSSAGRSVSILGGAHYTAAKAAILGFTRAVAKEVACFGITANSVCPGLIDTEMVRKDCSPEKIKKYEESFPVPRLGKAEEVGELVLFLCSGGDYITGAAIDINGGDLMI